MSSVSPLNVITTLNVIPTVNVIHFNTKVINLPIVNVRQLNAKCNNRVNLLNRAKDSQPSTSDFLGYFFFHFLGLFL